MADIYDECILGLNLIMDLRNELFRAPQGDIPSLAMETTTKFALTWI